MASAIRQMTSVGGDIRKIARLLQKKAPPGHMLAYINQEEADLLKARGGSGKPHEDTGVPSFEEEYVPDYSPTSQYTGGSYGDAENLGTIQYAAPETSGLRGSYENVAAKLGMDYDPTTQFKQVKPLDLTSSPYGDVSSVPSGTFRIDPLSEKMGLSATGSAPSISAAVPQFVEGTTPFTAAAGAPTDSFAAAGAPREGSERGAYLPKAKEPGFFESLSPDTKARLGIAGVQGVLGAYQAQQAAEQGRKAREDLQRLAQPYQEQGKKLIAQAQSGELTPAAQQQLQAAQAQAAQGAQARGGVGAQQTMAQVEALRQQLLQNQYDYGLKVSGIGDQIATGAIRTGLEADRYVNQLTGNYFTNIARTAYGQAPQVAGSPTYVREA